MSKTAVSELQKYFNACAKALDFSGVVLVAKDGKRIWGGAAGLANREHNVPNEAKTKFRLASITKPFTAVAIFMLQEKDKLKTSDPIGKHLKKTPKAWKKVTIYHLLTHTSGIPSYTEYPDHDEVARRRMSPGDLAETFKDKKLDFAPGEKFHYCNSGYVLLGLIIEAISGKTYSQFLRDNIFKPLGMNDTGLDDNLDILLHRAQGYSRTMENEVKNTGFLDMSIPYAAGGMYSTAEDLLRFESGLASGKLLSKASLKAMYKEEQGNYACGWGLGEFQKHKIVGHAGGINGFTTNFERIESERYCSIVLSNIEGAPVTMITDAMRSIIFGAPYTTPQTFKAIKVDKKVFRDYEGRYKLGPKFIVSVFTDGGKLVARANGEGKLVLVPHGKDEFHFVQMYAQITFERDKKGKVSHLVLHQNGQDTEAKRIGKLRR